MRLCKFRLATGEVRVGSLERGEIRLLQSEDAMRAPTLSDILHADEPARLARDLLTGNQVISARKVAFLPPVDGQEIWAAGVTYKRSQEARERESAGAARFYDLVYSAERPELFLKATARRVVGHGEFVHIRRDSRWSVPEPEFALVLSPTMRIVGYTIGNDMSSRDIEGENPLYLPQAKIYDGSCALGPVVTLADSMPPLDQVDIRLKIERGGTAVFVGSTNLRAMKRSCEELVQWLARENSFPEGAVLLTGTGIVPSDDFSLAPDDLVTIEITGIGELVNLVRQAPI